METSKKELNLRGTYAGIGSRKAPPDILTVMKELGKDLSSLGLLLRSGGAPGADNAFESGCDTSPNPQLKEIFLPWKEFNNHKSNLYLPSPKAFERAKEIHPNWKKCSIAAKKLHARNIHQILGKDLTSPVNLVVYWALEKNGVVQGGTATAVNLAKSLNIPTYNLIDKNIQDYLITQIYQNLSKSYSPKEPERERKEKSISI